MLLGDKKILVNLRQTLPFRLVGYLLTAECNLRDKQLRDFSEIADGHSISRQLTFPVRPYLYLLTPSNW